MAGPPRTPSEVLRLRGSWRGKTRTGEPEPEKGSPAMPEDFTDAEAVVWNRLTATLEGMQVVSQADWPELIRYCRQWVRWETCEAVIRREGMVYEVSGRNGKLIKLRPEVAEAGRLDASLKAIEMQFGLTPASRSRLSIEKPAPGGVVNRNCIANFRIDSGPDEPEETEPEGESA